MAIVPFKYYLNDNASATERAEAISEQAHIDISEDLMDKIGRPFYEVTLNCTLDTETGEVKILGVN